MTPYLTDIQSGFTISFKLSRSALATTLVFSAACIFTVEVHANPMWEPTDTRGADQECMCAANHSVGLLAMRVIRNRRNARRQLAPAGASREAPSESSARWGDSATRNPDTPPPSDRPPEAARADAGGGASSTDQPAPAPRRTATTEPADAAGAVVSPLRCAACRGRRTALDAGDPPRLVGARGRRTHPATRLPHGVIG